MSQCEHWKKKKEKGKYSNPKASTEWFSPTVHDKRTKQWLINCFGATLILFIKQKCFSSWTLHTRGEFPNSVTEFCFQLYNSSVLIGDVGDYGCTIVSIVCSLNVSIRCCLGHISLVTLVTKHRQVIITISYYLIRFKCPDWNILISYGFICLKLCYYYILICAEWFGSALKTEHMYSFHLSTPVCKLHYKSAYYKNHLEFSSDPFLTNLYSSDYMLKHLLCPGQSCVPISAGAAAC